MSSSLRFLIGLILIITGVFLLFRLFVYAVGVALALVIPFLAVVGIVAIAWLALRLLSSKNEKSGQSNFRKKERELASPIADFRDANAELERQRKEMGL